MLIAIQDGKRTRPLETGQRATCPQCNSEVLSKCGQINIWHWAHIGLVSCDPWSEHESEWHLNWKKEVPEDWIEITIGCHRADIRTPSGLVVELQHSSICVDDIEEREEFYGKMVWIFDVADAAFEDEDNDPRLDLRQKDATNYRSFRWKHAKKHIGFAQRPVFLDLGNGYMFLLKKMYTKAPVGGWGFLYRKEKVIRLLNEQQGIFAA